MKKETSYGVIPIYYQNGSSLRYLLVRQSQGHWSFPKGHPEHNESPLSCARREMEEETNIHNVRIQNTPSFHMTYTSYSTETEKNVILFLGYVNAVYATPQAGEILEAAWCSYDEARTRLEYENAKHVLDEAHAVITSQHRRKKGDYSK